MKKAFLVLLVLFATNISYASVSGFVVSNYEYVQDGSKTGRFYMPFVWLIFQKDLGENFGYHVWYDFQNGNFIMAWLDIKLWDYLTISSGKIVAPSNQEWYTYPPEQLTPYFSEVSNLVGELGKGFDYGIGLSGTLGKLTYNLAIFEGDPNDKKDFCGRLTIKPFKELEASIHTYQIWAYADEAKRDLSGVDIRYSGYNLDIRAEYDFGKADSLFTIGPNAITLGSYSGYYIMLGYKISLNSNMAVQPVFKYNVLDPRAEAFEPVTVLVGGVNFYMGEHFKMMVAYRKITDDTNTYYSDIDKKDAFTVRAQVSF